MATDTDTRLPECRPTQSVGESDSRAPDLGVTSGELLGSAPTPHPTPWPPGTAEDVVVEARGLSESWQTRSQWFSIARPLASVVSLPQPLFLERNTPSRCTCTVSFWRLPHAVREQTSLPVSARSDRADWVTQRSSLWEPAIQFWLTSIPSSRKPSLTLPCSQPALEWPLGQPWDPVLYQPGVLVSAEQGG